MIKTTDVYLSAALLALGYELKDVDREDVHHMEFFFVWPATVETGALSELDKKDKMSDAESQWANGTLMVCATKYADAIKRLKSVIHSHS